MTSADRLSAWGRASVILAIGAVFAFSRIYEGVRHDARLYFGDVLARLDPQGVGRDLVFAHDGQFGFSLYTPVLTELVRGLGLPTAALLVMAVSLLAWLGALVALAHRLLAGRPEALRWAAVVLAIAASPYYGAFQVFAVGEPFATPRILAEAAGMAALALYLADRRWAGVAVLAAAMVIHPIMALCGLGVLYVAFCLEDRRWLIPGLIGALAVVAAAVAGLPLAHRLTEVIDPVWRALCEARSPTLFVTQWPLEAWGRLVVQIATAALAVWCVTGRARTLFLAALAVAVLGLAASLILGDMFSLLLVLQAQTWRSLALLAILSILGLAACLSDLPRRGLAGLISAAALALAWVFISAGALALGLAGVAALGAVLARRPWPEPASPPVARAVWLVLALTLTMFVFGAGRGLVAALAARPPDGAPRLAIIWDSGVPGLIVAILALAWAWRPTWRPPLRLGLAGAALLAVVALMVWDARAPTARWREAGPDPVLVGLLAERPGAVLWIAGDTPSWDLARRPSWASRDQGAGMVFSRPLAVMLSARVERLIAVGLAGENARQPFAVQPTWPRPVTQESRDVICQGPDAPAWIVAPLGEGGSLDRALGARIWTPPVATPVNLGPRAGWWVIGRYGIIPCGPGG